jgi:hypothetical protein
LYGIIEYRREPITEVQWVELLQITLERFISSSGDRDGINISATDEKACGKELLNILPQDWKISFDWFRTYIFDADVKYIIDYDEKIVRVGYCQNLRPLWNQIISDIQKGLADKGVI